MRTSARTCRFYLLSPERVNRVKPRGPSRRQDSANDPEKQREGERLKKRKKADVWLEGFPNEQREHAIGNPEPEAKTKKGRKPKIESVADLPGVGEKTAEKLAAGYVDLLAVG